MLPVNAHACHDHDREHDRGADRAEKAEGDEEAARELTETGECSEGTARQEPQRPKELASPLESVPAKPSEQFLCAVRGHEPPNDESPDQQSRADRLRIDGSCDLHEDLLWVLCRR